MPTFVPTDFQSVALNFLSLRDRPILGGFLYVLLPVCYPRIAAVFVSY